MEHDMKISPSNVRRLRVERGWPQEQLAVASGLSLRTVQRVEAQGIASLNTAASLAATFAVPLIELQEGNADVAARPQPEAASYCLFLLGLVVITVAAIGESARLPGAPQADGLAALNILAALAGVVLLIPSAIRIAKSRLYVAAALAVIGMPLVTLLIGGAIVSLLGRRPPLWSLVGMGFAGAALVVMAVREFRRRSKAGRLDKPPTAHGHITAKLQR